MGDIEIINYHDIVVIREILTNQLIIKYKL